MSVPSVTIAKDRLRNGLITDISPEQFDVKITRTDIHIKYTGEKH